jgi:uncharacterized membrane protein
LATAPAVGHVIGSAWTESFLMLLLALATVCAVSRSIWLPVALGLLFAMKQYMVVFVPLLFLLLPQPLNLKTSTKFVLTMLITGAAVSLPLALWDWHAFWNSNVTIQVAQPFRQDAFGFLAVVFNEFNQTKLSSSIAFWIMIPTYVVLLWKLPRNIVGFTIGLAIAAMMFFFFNRQAFLNYHTFACSALLIAVAAIEATHRQPATAASSGADAAG